MYIGTTYIIRRGDSLESISERFEIFFIPLFTVEKLMPEWSNHINIISCRNSISLFRQP